MERLQGRRVGNGVAAGGVSSLEQRPNEERKKSSLKVGVEVGVEVGVGEILTLLARPLLLLHLLQKVTS